MVVLELEESVLRLQIQITTSIIWGKINSTYSITVLWALQIKLSLECKHFY